MRLDLNGVVRDAEKALRRIAGEEVDLVLELRPGLCAVEADVTQLHQVLVDLVRNARDAIEDTGTIRIETMSVELGDEDRAARPEVVPGGYARLRVSDTGAGVAPEHLPHVFEPFFTTKEESQGTGLGLSTVYGIVKQSDGYVWLESEVGQGTTAVVCLPCARGAPGSPGAAGPPQER